MGHGMLMAVIIWLLLLSPFTVRILKHPDFSPGFMWSECVVGVNGNSKKTDFFFMVYMLVFCHFII